MKKPKIAISLDRELLELVDSKVDGNTIRSRSQAIELFLRKGLDEYKVSKAVLLIKGSHQNVSLKKIDNKPVIERQIEFFSKYQIHELLIVTQKSQYTKEFETAVLKAKPDAKIYYKEAKHTADALFSIKHELENDFIVWSGDILAGFDLRKMIQKHLESTKLATMALMSKKDISKYGVALLEGNLIVGFTEKPEQAQTFVVNAGIYILKPAVFQMFNNPVSLERDVFPQLANMRQLQGFFMHGEYVHASNHS